MRAVAVWQVPAVHEADQCAARAPFLPDLRGGVQPAARGRHQAVQADPVPPGRLRACALVGLQAETAIVRGRRLDHPSSSASWRRLQEADREQLSLPVRSCMGGSDGKKFPLCPYCYNHVPFEGIRKVGSDAPGARTGMPCTICPHPVCTNSMVNNSVTACAECDEVTGRMAALRVGGRPRCCERGAK